MTVYIPENIEIKKILSDYPPKSGANPKEDYLAYVLGVVSSGIYYRRDLMARKKFVPIYSVLLKKLIGSNYNKYLKYLRRAKVLVCNKQYFKDHSRGYCFKKHPLKFKEYSIIDKKLIRKINSHFDKESEYASRKLPFLKKWFNAKQLSISKERAEAILLEKYAAKLNERIPYRSKMSKKEIADISMYCWKRSINSLAEKEYISNFIVDDSGGRLHTVLTHTSRSFRKFIRYDDKALVQIDISNSQPYFASVLLNCKFWENAMLSSRDRTRLNTKLLKEGVIYKAEAEPENQFLNINIKAQIKAQIKYNNYYRILMLLKGRESLNSQEFNNYRKLVSSGTFYEEVAKIYDTYDIKGQKPTKEKVKKWMFEVFFSPAQLMILLPTERPQARLFRNTFPRIREIFNCVKYPRHNTLALLLQNLESECILNHICPYIAEKQPNIPLFTIHDCIVTTAGNEGFVESIMKEKLESLTGLPAHLKIKYWDNNYDE